ncbi:PKD domain-containing protein [bacterium]|nr:PKD domain-containing protein [bacterium]
MKQTSMMLIAIVLLSVSFAYGQQNPAMLGPIDPGNDNIFRGWMSRDVANGYMYFKMYDGIGSEIHPTNSTVRIGNLWRTDGTPSGTTRYASAQVVGEVRAIGDLVYFTGADPDPNNWDDPWRSDGTAAGTFRLTDLGKRMSASTNEWDFESFNGAVYFIHGYNKKQFTTPVINLMTTDGTTNGTSVVASVPNGIIDLTPMGNDLFIYMFDLWKSDGTSSGTVELKDICPGTGYCSVEPYPLPDPYASSHYWRPFASNGTYYGRFADGVAGDELWMSDGTAAGTVMVKDINPGSGSSWPCMFAELNGELYFAAYDDDAGFELWKSDGTANGTVLVKDINPNGNSEPLWLTTVNTAGGDLLFFSADDGTNGRELWISDGTPGGTNMLKDINAYGSSNPRFTTFANYEYRCSDEDYMLVMTSYNGIVYFAADDGNGYELWSSDGTSAGTTKLFDINPAGSSNPLYITEVNGKILFFAYEPTYGYEWYSYDPSQPIGSNTPPVASFTATPSSGDAPLQVSFDASTSDDPDGSIVAYDWDFGDGSTGSGMLISHTYQNGGTYTATLTVTDDDSGIDQATASINVSSTGGMDIFVVNQLLSRVVLPGNRTAGQSLLTIEGNSAAVAGAEVFVSYSGPTTGVVSGFTDASGQVTIETASTKKDLNLNWCYTVTDIQLAGYTFNDQTGVPYLCEGSPKRSAEVQSNCLLHAPYPNPFGTGSFTGGSTANIRFALQESMHVSIRVYDALGREIITAVDEYRTAGSHNVQFNAGALPSGTYFVRLSSAEGVQSMRIVLQN